MRARRGLEKVRNMRRLRNSLILLVFAAAAFAQSAEEMESPACNRVAEKLLCPCGCKTNMACRMDPYPCRTCYDNKKKILKMQAAGMSDQAILGQFAKDMGKDVVAVPPGVIGSVSFSGNIAARTRPSLARP